MAPWVWNLCRRYRVSLCRASARQLLYMLMDHSPRCLCYWFVIQLHDRVVVCPRAWRVHA
jgi:hypothetical protein